MHSAVQHFVPESDDNAAAVLRDGRERAARHLFGRERRDSAEPAVRGYVALDVLARRDTAGQDHRDLCFALIFGAESNPILLQRLFCRTVQSKIRHGRNARHTADSEQFTDAVPSLKNGMRQRHGAFKVDARLHHKFFFGILFCGFLCIDPRNTDKAGELNSLIVRKGKERHPLCAVRKIARKRDDFGRGKVAAQLLCKGI